MYFSGILTDIDISTNDSITSTTTINDISNEDKVINIIAMNNDENNGDSSVRYIYISDNSSNNNSNSGDNYN